MLLYGISAGKYIMCVLQTDFIIVFWGHKCALTIEWYTPYFKVLI